VSFGLPVMAGWLGAQALAQVTALFLCLAPVMVLAWGLADAAAVRIAAVAGSRTGRPAQACGHRLAPDGRAGGAAGAGGLAAFAGAGGPLLRGLLDQPEL
jgi:hypothetical protein